jgi:nascent polypeptide-associated complex subunit alpha
MIPGMGGGMDPRQMSMMMKKLGIDVRDIEGVQEVVVRTATKDYVFERASVNVMKAQGVETWQISGKPRVVERGSAPAPPKGTQPAAVPAPAAPAPEPIEIPDEDIALVMKETGKSRAEAKAALESCNGDLAEAIVKLS